MKAAVKLIIAVAIFLIFPNFVKVSASIIGPDKYYLDIKDSEPINQTLKIYASNNQKKPYQVYIYVYGMKKIGDENDRLFYEPNPDDVNDVANWIKLSKNEETIYPNTDTLFQWTLEPPEGVLNCGTFAAGIVIAENPIPDGETNLVSASVKNEVISQVHVTITNDFDPECTDSDNLNLVDFKVDSSFPIFNYDEIPFKTIIENRSKYLAKNIRGFIEIKGIGSKVSIPFNDNGYDIYPSTTRFFSNQWIDPNYPRYNILEQVVYEIKNFKIGRYEVTLGITKNVQSPIIGTTYVYIIPWKVILLILIVIILIIVFFRNNYKTHSELKEMKKRFKQKIDTASKL